MHDTPHVTQATRLYHTERSDATVVWKRPREYPTTVAVRAGATVLADLGYGQLTRGHVIEHLPYEPSVVGFICIPDV
jgi:hypothetical protein